MQSSTSFEDSVSIALQYAEIVGAAGRSRLQVVECDIAYADFYNAGAGSHTVNDRPGSHPSREREGA